MVFSWLRFVEIYIFSEQRRVMGCNSFFPISPKKELISTFHFSDGFLCYASNVSRCKALSKELSMTFQIVQGGHGTFHMLEPNSCTVVNYYPKCKMKRLYPKNDYEVIGEIGNFSKRYSNEDEILAGTGKRIPVFPRGSLKSPFEWVTGYAMVGENTYVAVVKSIIPYLFYKKKSM